MTDAYSYFQLEMGELPNEQLFFGGGSGLTGSSQAASDETIRRGNGEVAGLGCGIRRGSAARGVCGPLAGAAGRVIAGLRLVFGCELVVVLRCIAGSVGFATTPRLLNAAALTLVLAEPIFADTCIEKSDESPQNLASAVEYLQDGLYDDFVIAIDPDNSLSLDKREKLSNGLKEVSESGFQSCSVLFRRGEENSVQYVVFLRQKDRHLFAFFLVGRIDGGWLILKTQVSTDIDEILSLVR